MTEHKYPFDLAHALQYRITADITTSGGQGTAQLRLDTQNPFYVRRMHFRVYCLASGVTRAVLPTDTNTDIILCEIKRENGNLHTPNGAVDIFSLNEMSKDPYFPGWTFEPRANLNFTFTHQVITGAALSMPVKIFGMFAGYPVEN